jgi:hypothetical protein
MAGSISCKQNQTTIPTIALAFDDFSTVAFYDMPSGRFKERSKFRLSKAIRSG